MRTLAWTLLGVGTMLITASAQAQTYDPNYPICLQTYGRADSYIACGYTSMAQCKSSASGRARAASECRASDPAMPSGD